jgi:ribonucleoside-diphosphate reductase alpha chain
MSLGEATSQAGGGQGRSEGLELLLAWPHPSPRQVLASEPTPPRVPDDVHRAFVTAFEIEPQWHLRMQAAFQRCADAAVSKTVNLPTSATVEAVKRIYSAAWRARLKGITIYRYGSRSSLILTFLSDAQGAPAPPVEVDAEYAGGCAGYLCEL